MRVHPDLVPGRGCAKEYAGERGPVLVGMALACRERPTDAVMRKASTAPPAKLDRHCRRPMYRARRARLARLQGPHSESCVPPAQCRRPFGSIASAHGALVRDKDSLEYRRRGYSILERAD